MTEDAIYAALLEIKQEQGSLSAKLDSIAGRLESGDGAFGELRQSVELLSVKLNGRPCLSQSCQPCPTQTQSIAGIQPPPPRATPGEQALEREVGAALLSLLARHWGKLATLIGGVIGGWLTHYL